ncbi:MAG: hypothetical protein V7K46_17250 [Nostoc sp.]
MSQPTNFWAIATFINKVYTNFWASGYIQLLARSCNTTSDVA